MIPKKAAIAAGYVQGSGIVTSLEEDAEVISRIAELTQEYQLRKDQQREAAIQAAKTVGTVTGLSKSWVLQQLASLAAEATMSGDFGQANHALELIGKEFDMFKGGSVRDDPVTNSQTIDVDKTDALLDSLGTALEYIPGDDAEEIPEPDFAKIERLIGTVNRVRAQDRTLTTGSETDVALTAHDITDQDQ